MSSKLEQINRDFANNPQELIEWAFSQGERPICTTNFRPFEAVILHMVTQVRPDIPIVWMDSGYNLPVRRCADPAPQLKHCQLFTKAHSRPPRSAGRSHARH